MQEKEKIAKFTHVLPTSLENFAQLLRDLRGQPKLLSMAPARKMKLAPQGTILGVVQREMNRRNLTGYALAKKLGNTSESHLGDWLKGDKSLSDGKLDEILKVLKIKIVPED